MLVVWALVLLTAVLIAVVRSRRARRVPAALPASEPARGTEDVSAPSTALVLAPRPRREPVIVFVHGFAGFGELRFGPARASYFRGVGARLSSMGIRAAFAELPAVGPLAARGAALARFLDELGDVDVHLVGHSMGGLDARWVAKNASPTNLRTLVTIATPHRGTPLADLGTLLVPRRTSLFLGSLAGGVADLSRTHLGTVDSSPLPGLTCASVIVAPAAGRLGVRPILRPTHRLIEALDGENDGIVPVHSQSFGDVLGRVDSDHCGVLGWTKGFDAPAFYGALAASILDGRPALLGPAQLTA